jgi:hypothetical protein
MLGQGERTGKRGSVGLRVAVPASSSIRSVTGAAQTHFLEFLGKTSVISGIVRAVFFPAYQRVL